MGRHRPSDHDMIQRVFHAVFDDGGIRGQQEVQGKRLEEIHAILVGGLNGSPGVLVQFSQYSQNHTRILHTLYGNPDAHDEEEKKGALHRLDDHISSHRKINAAIIGMLTIVATAVASMWRDILRGLGLMK